MSDIGLGNPLHLPKWAGFRAHGQQLRGFSPCPVPVACIIPTALDHANCIKMRLVTTHRLLTPTSWPACRHSLLKIQDSLEQLKWKVGSIYTWIQL